jgi:hypothetical protein
MNYHSIKRSELKTTENYSERKFKIYLKIHYILLSLYSELFFWTISFIPFITLAICIYPENLNGIILFFHFLCWKLFAKRKYHELCDKDIEDLELTIEVLEDIKKERNRISA